MFNVEFSGGKARFGNDSVNYMLVEIDGEELYAEHLVEGDPESPDYDEFEGFEKLKEEIIEQAAKLGIGRGCLIFEE